MNASATLLVSRYSALLSIRRLQMASSTPFLHQKGKGFKRQPWAPSAVILDPPKPDRDLVLKVGYLSAQYGANSLGWTMQSVFAAHDRHRFRAFAVSMTPGDDSAVKRKIESSAEAFVDLSRSSVVEAAKTLNDLRLHILVDLDGYRDIDVLTAVSDLNQILALRPAPLSVNWLGSCSSQGADFIPFIISDRVSSPPEFSEHFTESLVLLPTTFSVSSLSAVYQNMSRILVETVEHSNRKHIPSTNDGLLFGDFNKVFKIEPQIFARWMHILTLVPGSKLMLGEAAPLAQENLRKAAQNHSVEPSRLLFPPTNVSHGEHVTQRLPKVDIILDTLHVDGHTTSKDALFAAVPVVGLPTGRMVGRVGTAVTLAGGGGIGVARTLEDYVDLAHALATQPKKLKTTRRRIFTCSRQSLQQCDDSSCGLFDLRGILSDMESAYRLMWERVSSASKRYFHVVLHRKFSVS
mmetsp:Transcript_40649/g.63489  ORF Transcript_40649/g.63489 Transcript_40649/m.63489 type:complete len:464 (-) Transcript_40649:48-1439(-)